MNDSTAKILDVAQLSAREAAKVLLRFYGQSTIQEKGTSQNIVTQADLASEQRITEIVRAAFPEHAMLREESDVDGDVDAEHLWVVDPLDATTNYAHGIPHFCVSIAYVRRGQPQVGVVLDPLRDEMFCAVRGEGATCNGRAIRVAQPAGLHQAVIATGFYYDRGTMMERTLDSVRALFQHNIRGLRRIGAAALDLSWVACGRFGGFFEYKLGPWDYAAGWLIVEEAGGVCLDRAGRPLTLDAGRVIAACPAVLDDFARLVVWPNEEQ